MGDLWLYWFEGGKVRAVSGTLETSVNFCVKAGQQVVLQCIGISLDKPPSTHVLVTVSCIFPTTDVSANVVQL